MRNRLTTVHQRAPDGSLRAIKHEIPQDQEFNMGGGGLYGTAPDYVAFLRMLLNGGRASSGEQVLKPETIAEMSRNSVGALKAGVLKSVQPNLSNDVDLFPGMEQKWGPSFLINAEAPRMGVAPEA